jgi:hypothetical protein
LYNIRKGESVLLRGIGSHMNKQVKVISLKERKREKKYRNLKILKKYTSLILSISVVLTCIYGIDNSIIRYKHNIDGLEYKPYYEIHKDYILNETDKDEYIDLKNYYNLKQNALSLLYKQSERIMKQQEQRPNVFIK